MLDAAEHLFRVRGYRSVSMVDAAEHGSAPRGSIYFHFPGGKEQLGAEVAAKVGAGLVEIIDDAATRARTPAGIVERLCNALADRLVASGYTEGCPLAPIAIEMVPESETLHEASGQAFGDWRAALTARMIEKGLPASQAPSIAEMTISAIEGALVLGRIDRSVAPLKNVSRMMSKLIRAETTRG